MDKHTRTPQSQRIIKWLEEFGSITQYEALTELGVMRLASRIAELKKRGIEIASDWVRVKNRYGEHCDIKRYRFAEKQEVV